MSLERLSTKKPTQEISESIPNYNEWLTMLQQNIHLVELKREGKDETDWNAARIKMLVLFRKKPEILFNHLTKLQTQDPIMYADACLFVGHGFKTIRQVGHPTWDFHLGTHLYLGTEYCRAKIANEQTPSLKMPFETKPMHHIPAADLLFLSPEQITKFKEVHKQHFEKILADFVPRAEDLRISHEIYINNILSIYLYKALDLVIALKQLEPDVKQQILNGSISIETVLPNYDEIEHTILPFLNDGTVHKESYNGLPEQKFAYWLQEYCEQLLDVGTSGLGKMYLQSTFVEEFCLRFLETESQLNASKYNPNAELRENVLGINKQKLSNKNLRLVQEHFEITGRKPGKKKKKKGFGTL